MTRKRQPKLVTPTTGTEQACKGVHVIGDALYTFGDYSIYIGYIENKEQLDIPHYLIVNDRHGVVEGSSPRLAPAILEARDIADTLLKVLENDGKRNADFSLN